MKAYLDLYLSREKGEIAMPQYWWRPTEEQFNWAVEFLIANAPGLAVYDTGDGSHDGARDTVYVDGWVVDVDDDGVWAREGESMWTSKSSDDVPVTLSGLPPLVRAVVFFLGAYRASWWPGGVNYDDSSIIFALQRLFAPSLFPKFKRFVEIHSPSIHIDNE